MSGITNKLKKKIDAVCKSGMSLLLAAAMVISGLPISGLKDVNADDRTLVTVENATDTSKPVYVEFVEETASSTNTYKQYKANVVNNSGGTISDWQIKMVFNVNAGWNAGWCGASYDSLSNIITVNTYGETTWTNSTVYANQKGEGAGFQIADGALNNATVTLTYYNGESTQSGGGSGGSDSGSVAGALADTTTDYGYSDIEYNYAKLLQYSLYFYDANMCGSDVGENSLLAWRNDCHTYDAAATYNGRTIDVSGGYHDAGDHVKFGLPQAYSASVLGMSYVEFKEAFDELGQTGHLQTILQRFCDYFVKCTVLDSSGNVETFCYQVGDGGSDHAYWGAPEDQTLAQRGNAHFTSNESPCTDIVGETAAALAIYVKAFPNDEKSETYASYAKKLFAYADNMGTKKTSNAGGESSAAVGGFYNSQGYEDDMILAAYFLSEISTDTNEKQAYESKANSYAAGLNAGWPLCWDDVKVTALSYVNGFSQTATVMNDYGNRKHTDGYTLVEPWGSARYNTSLQFIGLVYDKHMGSSVYSEWAKGQMKYLLGNNEDKQCYIVGYNGYSSKYPHHRAASGYTGSQQGTKEQANVLLGALVGGLAKRNGSDEIYYDDTAADYTCNEVALDYNATLVGAAAGLYLLEKDDATQTIDMNYYCDSDDSGGTGNNIDSDDNDTGETESSASGSGQAPQVPTQSDDITVTEDSDAIPTEDIKKSLGVDDVTAEQIQQVAKQYNISPDTLKITNESITAKTSDEDMEGADFASLQARVTKNKKTSVKIKWNKVSGADGYLIYGNQCNSGGKKYRLELLKDLSSAKTSYTAKKLKKGKYYKFLVVAYKNVNGKKVTLASSVTIHTITKGGKYGVAKAVKITKIGTKKNVAKVTLQAGKSAKIKAIEVKADKTIRRHRKICFESSDIKVATVSKTGKIKAVNKGKCKIYVYAQNGIYKVINVTVK